MMPTRAVIGSDRIFDGYRWHDGAALLLAGDVVAGVVPVAEVPDGIAREQVDGGLLVPGFIDLQVNGGGGVQFNDQPDFAGIQAILSAHAQFGCTALLPTLITDTPEVTARAMAAGVEAARANLPGFLGLHLEGPHLAVARKGAHPPALIRPMNEWDLAALVALRPSLPHLLVTLAAETVPPEQISALAAAGITVSIGHSDAGFAQVKAAQVAGASMVTHLFNAQSQLLGREPGVVGGALALGGLSAGLIVDGIHVHPASVAAALRAKSGPGRIFLVSDAMAPSGTDDRVIELHGRTIHRKDGALRLPDGTLAGADLTMIDAVRLVQQFAALPLDEALRMAALYPAEAIGDSNRGHFRNGANADWLWLTPDLEIRATVIAGATVYQA